MELEKRNFHIYKVERHGQKKPLLHAAPGCLRTPTSCFVASRHQNQNQDQNQPKSPPTNNTSRRKKQHKQKKTPFSPLPLFFLFLSTQTIVYFTDFSFLDSRVTFFFNKLERERERERERYFFFTFFFLCELGESTQWNMFFSGDPSTRKRVDLGGRSSKERDRQKLLEQTRLERNRRLWLRQQNSAALKIQVRIFCFLLLLAIFKFRVSVLFAN